jgi:23S rRNA-/tRNA-specific pseudouridylate synthase
MPKERLEKDYLALVHGRFPERADSAGYLIADIASAVRKKRRYVESRELRRPQGKGVESCVTCFELVGSRIHSDG